MDYDVHCLEDKAVELAKIAVARESDLNETKLAYKQAHRELLQSQEKQKNLN